MLESPPFETDVRIATSAVEGLRFGLATRIADLGDLAGRLETLMVRTSARRVQVRGQLRENETARPQVVAARHIGHPGELEAVFRGGLELCAEMAVLDERLATLEGRLQGIQTEMETLRSIGDHLREAIELRGTTIDGEVVRRSRASRGLVRLVHDDCRHLRDAALDGPVQELADVAVRLELVRRLLGRRLDGAGDELSHARAAAQRAALGLEGLVFDIRPEELDAGGAVAAVRELGRRVPPPVACRVEVIGESRRLGSPLEVGLFRIAQEAVRNALVHGHPQRIDIVLSLPLDRVVLMVRDDGEGFDVAATESLMGRSAALGIILMRERAEALGGALKLRSAAGAGTEVRATVPLAGRRSRPR